MLKQIVTYYDHCHLLDGATSFSEVGWNKLRRNVKNEMTLICFKFGADLINTFEATSCKIKWSSCLRHPDIYDHRWVLL